MEDYGMQLMEIYGMEFMEKLEDKIGGKLWNGIDGIIGRLN